MKEGSVKKAVQRKALVMNTVQHKFNRNERMKLAVTTLQSLRELVEGMRPGGFEGFKESFPDVVTAMTVHVTCRDIVLYVPRFCSEQPAVVPAGEGMSLTPPGYEIMVPESWKWCPKGAPVAQPHPWALSKFGVASDGSRFTAAT
jgi:hypothetical protein